MSCRTAACCARHPRACEPPPRRSSEVRAPPNGVFTLTSLGSTVPSSAASDPVARRVLRKLAIGGQLAVSHTNGANLPFARNWYAHLQRARVRNFALIATDEEAFAALSRELPSRVVRCPHTIAAHRGRAQPLRYRSSGWTRLMFAVPKMVRWVLRMDVDVLWMDTDVVTLSDPFPVLSTLLEGKSREELSLLASVDGRVPDENVGECRVSYSKELRWGGSAGGWKLCGGLFFIRHSTASRDFLRMWEQRLQEPHAGAKNQPHYNEALRSSKLPFRLLPCELFPNGYRYASAAWRSKFARINGSQPVLVHNNWIKGHEAKLSRFRMWGMWVDPALNATQTGSETQQGLRR
ncbi:hypothetical protein AB1Y20_010632 [Prymnesium parvum]|uniref:Nucleotide-diphospho-sugar transferase domain-containing protein n=1 Tax=Prymnesium parvum TaxID=97485 RepID=A0AB34ISF3_PRYPA